MTQKMYCGLVFLQHFIVTKGTQEESNQFLQLCLKIGSPEDLMNRLILINTLPISKLAISRQLYHVNPCYTPIFKHQTPFAAQAARPSISGGASAGAVPKAWLSEALGETETIQESDPTNQKMSNYYGYRRLDYHDFSNYYYAVCISIKLVDSPLNNNNI